MNKQFLLFFFVVGLGPLSSQMKCQSIWFRFNNGLEEAYNLTDVSKITYGSIDAPLVSLTLSNNNLINYNFADIRSYYFSGENVSVSERMILDGKGFVAFPNPVDDNVVLSWIASDNHPLTISLSDIKGQQVESISLPAGPLGLRSYSLSMQSLQSGIYIARLTGKNSSFSTKLIKN